MTKAIGAALVKQARAVEAGRPTMANELAGWNALSLHDPGLREMAAQSVLKMRGVI